MKVDKSLNGNLTDLELLKRLKPLYGFSDCALRELASSLSFANFERGDFIISESAPAPGVKILLRGAAKITCLNRSGDRVTVDLIGPGPIPEFPSVPVGRWHFRCEAYGNCRVGSLRWDQFDAITRTEPHSVLREFHENNLLHCYRFFGDLDLRERLLFTLKELSSKFGVLDSRGTLLPLPLSHKDLAEMVGASRPRVTEHLAGLVHEHLLIRQGRQLIVCLDKIEDLFSVQPAAAIHSLAPADAQRPKAGQTSHPRSFAPLASMKPLYGKSSDSPVLRPRNSSNVAAGARSC
jgi:CRP-like cAMP-binding protein